MQIVGHTTRSISDRYPIVSDGDVQEAAKHLDTAFLSQTMTKAMATPILKEAETSLAH